MSTPWNDERIAMNGRSVRENFGAWFSGSKAVDQADRPLMLFHGTTSEFDSFAMPPRSKSMAAYFTDSPSYANFYTRGPKLNHIGGVLIPVYLKITRPYVVDDDWCPAEWPSDPSERRKLINKGFDGIYWNDPETGDSMWIAFHPTQVKSAIGNVGLYLANSGSLTDRQAAAQLELAHLAKQAASRRLSDGAKP